MAQLQMERIVDNLSSDFRRALEATFEELGIIGHDRNDVYRAFKRQVGRKFSSVVEVPDQYVETTCRHCRNRT